MPAEPKNKLNWSFMKISKRKTPEVARCDYIIRLEGLWLCREEEREKRRPKLLINIVTFFLLVTEFETLTRGVTCRFFCFCVVATNFLAYRRSPLGVTRGSLQALRWLAEA